MASIIQVVNRIRSEYPQANEPVKEWLDWTWCMAIAEVESEEAMAHRERVAAWHERSGYGKESRWYRVDQ